MKTTTTSSRPAASQDTHTRAASQPDNRASTQQTRPLLQAIDQSARLVTQRQLAEAIANSPRQVAQRAAVPPAPASPNRTGLPTALKNGVESLSGYSLDDVRVRYNSGKPAQLQAHAYAQGPEIHLAPGQERHLPHEAWHVVQQKQGRVQATRQLRGVALNDSATLEREADLMGARALREPAGRGQDYPVQRQVCASVGFPALQVMQRRGTATLGDPNNTQQTETRGSTFRSAGQQRPANVAQRVDLFKKEMLTYIASLIKPQGSALYGPHVAVIITGNAWKISTNTGVDQTGLQQAANAAKQAVDAKWQAVHAKFPSGWQNIFSPSWLGRNASWLGRSLDVARGRTSQQEWRTQSYDVDAEALYVAFRWAASKTAVQVVANNQGTLTKKQRVHGEMQILRTIHNPPLAPDALPQQATDRRRVIRVGGTKTPCFDCGWEMNKSTVDAATINVGGQGGGAIHTAQPEAQVIGMPGGREVRIATTMSPVIGPSFPTWQHPDRVQARRESHLANPGADANHLADQSQDFNALRAAYTAKVGTW